MYEKARRGESIELSPRRISIFQFDIERSLDDRYPRFCLDVDKIWPMKPIIVDVVKSYIYLMAYYIPGIYFLFFFPGLVDMFCAHGLLQFLIYCIRVNFAMFCALCALNFFYVKNLLDLKYTSYGYAIFKFYFVTFKGSRLQR